MTYEKSPEKGNTALEVCPDPSPGPGSGPLPLPSAAGRVFRWLAIAIERIVLAQLNPPVPSGQVTTAATTAPTAASPATKARGEKPPRASSSVEPAERPEPVADQLPLQHPRSLYFEFPDLVDKALFRFPEAMAAVAKAVQEWYKHDDEPAPVLR